MTVSAAWEVADLTWGVAIYKKTFDTLNSLKAGGMGKPRRTRNITTGVNIWNRGLVAVINADETTVIEFRLNPTRENGSNANGNEANVGGDGLVPFGAFDINGYRVAIILKVDTLGIGQVANSLFGERFLKFLADFFVFNRK